MINNFEHFALRSVTYTVDLEKISVPEYQQKVKNDLVLIKQKFIDEKIFVRTMRFNILKIAPADRIDQYIFLKKIKILSDFSNDVGIRWFNIAFDLVNLDTKNVKSICRISYEVIKRYSNSFVNFIVGDKEKVNPFAALTTSKIILDISKLSFNGYDNFRVGISLNPSNNTPFFPFSYAEKDLSFSIAVEITERVINCIKSNKRRDDSHDLQKLEETIFNDLSPFVCHLENVCSSLSKELEIIYGGQDLSLAPFPEDKISVIEILHLLGVDDIGANGTLFFTSYLTGIVKSLTKENNAKASGFNGVMYSLLEDHLMCEANNKKLLSIDRIIGYSTLCGCGLDMVPIPGNLLVEELASIVLDVAATASKLNKPLGVRVLPIPNKESNEFTEFDMDFLTNTRVMDIKNLSCSNEIFQNTSLKIR
jgi:uncharacterized protein